MKSLLLASFAFMFLVSAATVNASEPTISKLEQLTKDNSVVILVDSSLEGTRITSQTLTMYKDGYKALTAPVSTGRSRYATPVGEFKATHSASSLYVSYAHQTISNAVGFTEFPVVVYGLERKVVLGKQSTMGGIQTTMDASRKIFEAARNRNNQSVVIVVYR